jgi:hypothetical protein
MVASLAAEVNLPDWRGVSSECVVPFCKMSHGAVRWIHGAVRWIHGAVRRIRDEFRWIHGAVKWTHRWHIYP